MKIISLGWGTQSFTLAAMSALGEIEKIDYAIHSDTTHERSATYEFADRWTKWLEEKGIKVVTVRDNSGSTEIGTVDEYGGVFIPAFTSNGITNGLLRRQCTGRWKIAPMRRWLQENRKGSSIEQWLGISMDEIQRMKRSNVNYIENRWPLIEMKMSRWDCIRWLQDHNLEVPPRSACVFCPYHSRSEWRDIRNNAPEDWKKAVFVDEQIRKARPPHDLFVNVQRKPLDECDLDNEIDNGQLSLWNNECDGYCGV